MKKFAPLLTALVVIGVIFILFRFFPSKKSAHKRPRTATAGTVADSFVLHFTGDSPYSLRDCIKKYTAVLSFTGTDNISLKYTGIVKNDLLPAISSRSDVAWFNIEKKDGYYMVSESTGKFQEKYRMAARQLPQSYYFKELPAVVIVDRSGVIKLIYMGYSPIIAQDILLSLGK